MMSAVTGVGAEAWVKVSMSGLPLVMSRI
jgi:hypothetical protein